MTSLVPEARVVVRDRWPRRTIGGALALAAVTVWWLHRQEPSRDHRAAALVEDRCGDAYDPDLGHEVLGRTAIAISGCPAAHLGREVDSGALAYVDVWVPGDVHELDALRARALETIAPLATGDDVSVDADVVAWNPLAPSRRIAHARAAFTAQARDAQPAGPGS